MTARKKFFINVCEISDSEYEDYTLLGCDIPSCNFPSHVAYSYILKVIAAHASETLVPIVPSHMESYHSLNHVHVAVNIELCDTHR